VVNDAVGYDADIWVINAGVNNLFDTEYADYLDGYNRVMDSNIQFNQHMPAMGMGD
jgi:iron complex outermembrane receptor protein